MKSILKSSLLTTLVLAASLPAMAAASGATRADKVAEKLLGFEKALQGANTQIDSVMGSLNALMSAQGNDLAAKYKVFSDQVKKTESMAKNAKTQAEAAKKRREEYIAAMQKDQEKVMNEQLKAAMEARKAELEPMIDQIRSSLTSASENFKPFMQDLKDLNLFLGNDLSPSGITAAQPLVTKCNDSSAKVKADVEKGAEGVRNLAARIKPGGAAQP